MIEFKAGDIVTVNRLNCYDLPITQTVQLIERQTEGHVPGWKGVVHTPRKQKGRLTWIADGEMPDLPGQEILRTTPQSRKFTIQTTEKSHCGICNGYLDLLCENSLTKVHLVMFWICWPCKRVTEVGVGEVPREA